jgi:hypothetical protein
LKSDDRGTAKNDIASCVAPAVVILLVILAVFVIINVPSAMNKHDDALTHNSTKSIEYNETHPGQRLTYEFGYYRVFKQWEKEEYNKNGANNT